MSRRGFIAGAATAATSAVIGIELLGNPQKASAAVSWGYPFAARSGRSRGFTGRYSAGGHAGIDYIPGIGTPIHAVADGTITLSGVSGAAGAFGESIWIQHADGYRTIYAHMKEGTRVQTGPVTRGQYIGQVGNTGSSTGPHLHIELHLNGVEQDPDPYINNAPLAGSGPDPVQIGGVKEIAVHGSGWSAIPVGQSMSNVFSAVNMGSGWGDIYGSFGGRMQLVGVSGGAWTRMDSGLALNATSLSALNVGQGFPHVFAVENGVLQHISANNAGWQKQSTGVSVPGKISGVVLPGNNVQLVANVGGVMHHITSHSGWEIGNSGIPIGSEFKAVNVGGQLQIVTVLNGIIHLIWPGAGWQLQSTGLPASGSLTAVDMGGGYPTIIANEGWNIVVTSVSNGGWVRQAMGVATSGNIDAVNLGGGYPTIYAV